MEAENKNITGEFVAAQVKQHELLKKQYSRLTPSLYERWFMSMFPAICIIGYWLFAKKGSDNFSNYIGMLVIVVTMMTGESYRIHKRIDALDKLIDLKINDDKNP